MEQSRAPPVHAWIVLGIAVLAVSSAGAVFMLMSDVTPLLRAAWRLQATSIVLLPFFIWQLKNESFDWTRKTFWIIFGSGICLWIHFGSWVWSLDHTSLAHSLLFVTAHPLIIVTGMVALRMQPHRWETWGALIGVFGAILAVQDAGSGSVTLIGDAAAFLGAIAIVGYLAAGRYLRSERQMPLFLYAFPVTAICAILLTIHAVFAENATLDLTIVDISVFGWTDMSWILLVGYLALGPGLAGHTGINASLKWLPPLVISVCVVLEPLLGGLLGWVLGVQGVPNLWTWVGGPFMLVGMALTIVGTNHRLTEEPVNIADN
ncbi:MAG: DMT family transporter [Candidatus Poseidoniales archaeon]|nr:DMT family transporter [Candidatus Poseidoniales archaeon]